MASGNTLFVLTPQGSVPTGTLFATQDRIIDASTPATETPVLDFDPTTAEHADWHVSMPAYYGGGGLTFSWKGGTDHASSVGTFTLDIRCVKVANEAILTSDLGIDAATATGITDTPPATPTNKLNYSIDGTMTHVNAGSPAVRDRLIIRASRNISDTNLGDLQLAEILVSET